VKATIQGANTRVSLDDDGGGSFTDGDVIYVSKLTSSGNVDRSYSNIKYTYNGTEFESSKTYYFETDGSSVTFVASNFTNSTVFEFISYEDQTKGLADDNYFNAKTSCSMRNPEANFEFKYCLSKITLKFSSKISSCTLSGTNIYKDALIYSGSVSANTMGDDSAESVKCYVSPETYETAEAILVPCSTDAEISIEVVSDGKTYKGTIPSTTIVANTHYIYNIKINDVLTIEDGEQIQGFEDSDVTFEVESEN
jgi:hypothetical protein